MYFLRLHGNLFLSRTKSNIACKWKNFFLCHCLKKTFDTKKEVSNSTFSIFCFFFFCFTQIRTNKLLTIEFTVSSLLSASGIDSDVHTRNFLWWKTFIFLVYLFGIWEFSCNLMVYMMSFDRIFEAGWNKHVNNSCETPHIAHQKQFAFKSTYNII